MVGMLPRKDELNDQKDATVSHHAVHDANMSFSREEDVTLTFGT
jgi:hypothetical protein